jgi:hypothetical protein
MAAGTELSAKPTIAAQGSTANDFLSDAIMIKATQGAYVASGTANERLYLEVSNVSADGPWTFAYKSAANVANPSSGARLKFGDSLGTSTDSVGEVFIPVE